MIIDFAGYREALAVKSRLTSGKPYCGVCYEADGEINDLYGVKRYDGPNTLACERCGEEFPE